MSVCMYVRMRVCVSKEINQMVRHDASVVILAATPAAPQCHLLTDAHTSHNILGIKNRSATRRHIKTKCARPQFGYSVSERNIIDQKMLLYLPKGRGIVTVNNKSLWESKPKVAYIIVPYKTVRGRSTSCESMGLEQECFQVCLGFQRICIIWYLSVVLCLCQTSH